MRRLVLILNDISSSSPLPDCLLDLSRPPDSKLRGDPFVPVRACAVDAFPHTDRFAVGLLLLRADVNDLLNPSCLGEGGLGAGWGPEEEERAVGTSWNESLEDDPGPDLSWKPVNSSQQQQGPSYYTSGYSGPKSYYSRIVESVVTGKPEDKPEKDYREALLSKEQRDWLQQMSAIYLSDFKRKEWTEALLRQNRQALEQQRYQQQQQQYSQQQQQQQQQRQMPVHPGAGARTDAAWKAYCRQMAKYWAVAGTASVAAVAAGAIPSSSASLPSSKASQPQNY